nr:NADH dehydrogenase subunit 6 [Priolepis eugenius]
MSFTIYMLMSIMLAGVLVVISNSSPYFGALGLVIFGCAGCGLLAFYGKGFLALVLFLIYLGGMLVVFAYTSALASDPYPEAWETPQIGAGLMTYLGGVLGGAGIFWVACSVGLGNEKWALIGEVFMFNKELYGVGALYLEGGGALFLTAGVMLVMLFVVLELTRGGSRGALRGV